MPPALGAPAPEVSAATPAGIDPFAAALSDAELVRTHTVWTGNSLLVFGGTDSQGAFPDATYSFSLTKPMYLYKKP